MAVLGETTTSAFDELPTKFSIAAKPPVNVDIAVARLIVTADVFAEKSIVSPPGPPWICPGRLPDIPNLNPSGPLLP